MIEEDFKLILSANISWHKFSNKIILITGANGFLPAYMVETLLLLNDELFKNHPCKVIALVRNKEHTNERFRNYSNDKNFEIIVQDVSCEIKIDQNIDFIIHAASPASPKYYNIDPVGVSLPNVLGTINTLELARQKNIEGYLYFSSSEVYGRQIDTDTINENQYGYLDPTEIRSCYGESKRMGENLCISYGYQYDIPIKIVRPFHTYGPGMKLDDGRVFADFVKNIVNLEDIALKSDGSAVRSFCYLADATVAFFKVLLEGKNNNAYNVSNPYQTISIKKLARILVNMFPEKNLKATFVEQDKNYLESAIKSNIADISKLQSLSWYPETNVEDGFKKTIRSYV